MRVVTITRKQDLENAFRELKVDPYGIKIMAPKAINYLVRVNSISLIQANILKQEMLSLGADVALPRDVLTGTAKKTDCIIIGNLSQYKRLAEKLNFQPFGLKILGKDLSRLLANYQKNDFIFRASRNTLHISQKPLVMGILNITPDSLSADGLANLSLCEITDHAHDMIASGASILDLGGESTRPGAKSVSTKEEAYRVIPVIRRLAKKIRIPISIDTYKAEVAKQALDAGATIVNDITGLVDPHMRKTIAKYKAGAIIMHMQGKPATMQKNPFYASVIDEILLFLKTQVEKALDSGIAEQNLVIDPGIGFGKTVHHNLEIIKRLSEFKVLGLPLLVGTSRKAFIGSILGLAPEERLMGTIASCVLAAKTGANILRVHDVKEVTEALKITQAILNQ